MRAKWTVTDPAVVTLVVFSALSVTGCAASHGFYEPKLIDAASPLVTLSVVNHSFEDVRVYALHGSTPVPVGTVAGMQSRRFTISRPLLGGDRTLRLAIVATPSRARIAMIPLDVGQGQHVEARIASNLRHSTVQLRYPPL